MSIYEQRLNRSIHKNIAALKELQQERETKRRRDLDREIEIAKARDIEGQTYQAPKRPSENGFVFSTAEVLAEANRETVVHDCQMKVFHAKRKIQFDGAWENYNPSPSPNRPNSGLTMVAAA